jgi:hypothetical protein
MPQPEVLTRVRHGVRERRCNRCEMWFPEDRFERNRQCVGGMTGECRLCRAERRLYHPSRMTKRTRAEKAGAQ